MTSEVYWRKPILSRLHSDFNGGDRNREITLFVLETRTRGVSVLSCQITTVFYVSILRMHLLRLGIGT
jgi:hypothetical protein